MDYETWSGLVERYSRCKLTHQTDKLVAISGLARISQSEMNDEYVAGLWKGDLELQLGWYALNPVPRTDPYVAPTWSWASLDAPIELARQDLRSGEDLCIEVADIQITHASSDIHGEVRSANLLLSCKFILRCVIKLENPGEKSAFIDIGKGTIEVKVMLDCLRLGDWQDHATYLVPIKVLKDANEVSGLLLLRIDGTNGRYIRLGVFKTASRYYRNILKQALESPSKQIEREAYTESTRDANFKKRYTISIA